MIFTGLPNIDFPCQCGKCQGFFSGHAYQMSPNFLIYFQMEKFLRTTLEMHVILERAHLNVQITIRSHHLIIQMAP